MMKLRQSVMISILFFNLSFSFTLIFCDSVGPESVFTCGLRSVRGNELTRVRTKAKRRLRVDSKGKEEGEEEEEK